MYFFPKSFPGFLLENRIKYERGAREEKKKTNKNMKTKEKKRCQQQQQTTSDLTLGNGSEIYWRFRNE